MSLEIRKLIQAIGGGGLQAQVIAMLDSVGGSLWGADPQYLALNSDGTGAVTDGSAVGYMRDLCAAARHMTQPTTAAKPLINRAPTKLGSELVVNGDFSSGSTGWALQSGFSVGAGNLSLSNPANGSYTNQTIGIENGKRYLVTYEIKNYVSGIVRVNLGRTGGTVGASRTANGIYSEVLVAAGTFQEVVVQANAASTVADVDNISVCEVLEDQWALQFDGVNDFLSTVSLPAVAAETMIIAGQFTRLDATGQGMVWKRSGNNGLFIRKSTSGATDGTVMTGSGVGGALLRSPENGESAVFGLRASNGACAGRVNGAQVWANSQAFVSAATPLQIGAETSATLPMQGNIYVTAYAPVTLTDAQCLLIERYFGSLSGVTIP